MSDLTEELAREIESLEKFLTDEKKEHTAMLLSRGRGHMKYLHKRLTELEVAVLKFQRSKSTADQLALFDLVNKYHNI